MNSPDEQGSANDASDGAPGHDRVPFSLRSYQDEMVEESLGRNLIVAMDTGSGKTHIALSSTAAELETCDPSRIVWFLAPSVTLCDQQFKVFQSQLPQYGIVFLSGQDNYDHWSDQSTWDAVLHNKRIVISTHQVLLDALSHAFVKLSQIALLIFDEAHHCVANHPANQIMSKFYMPVLQARSDSHLPRILGLSASPVMKARASGSALQEIETNLNAIAKTPKLHRSELMNFVHRPELQKIDFSNPIDPERPPFLAALQSLYHDYDMMTDPWVLHLLEQHQQGYDCAAEISKAVMKRKTNCCDQLKAICTKADAMFKELGHDPAEWYIRQCMGRYRKMAQNGDQQLLDWSIQEKEHLSKLLKSLPVSTSDSATPDSWKDISPKVEKLIDVLVSEACTEFTGLVFVKQRTWVAALGEIISSHPRTKDLFTVGTFVGTSSSAKKKANLGDLAEPRNQQDTLDHFRAGKINLILATSVLEEGIDVSSCNLVICFEQPENLKSFIQRRGRARKQKSKYIIFTNSTDGSARSPYIWEKLEEEMKEAYLNDLRDVKEAERKEAEHEEGSLSFMVPSSGALLDSDNALQHLQYFCSKISSEIYDNTQPQYTFKEVERGGITAEVLLPLSVDPSLRRATSANAWRTERMASTDAAFQAYRALHSAGLVNDNLLANRQEQDEQAADFQKSDNTASMIKVSPPYDPWLTVAQAQEQHPRSYHQVLLKLGLDSLEMVLLSPSRMPEIPKFILHWNQTTTLYVESLPLPDVVLDDTQLAAMRTVTQRILSSVFSGDLRGNKDDMLWLLVPNELRNSNWDCTSLENFWSTTQGYTPASDHLQKGHTDTKRWGLVNIRGDARKFMAQGISAETNEDRTQIIVTRTPKRRDFLHRIPERQVESHKYTRTELLNAAACDVSNLPLVYSIFALLVPSIIHKFEVFMIADRLRTTILAPLSFGQSHLPLLLQSMTSSNTGEEVNYQRLEFLGDCILKFISSVHLMAAHPTWPEAFLTGKKGKVVSNGFLARATMAAGLDKFIITKRFTGRKWTPQYARDILAIKDASSSSEPVKRSSKTLADVIESLIGASYTIGGFPLAFTCMQTLLSQEPWTSIPAANDILFSAAATNFSPSNLSVLERIIGHTFTKKQLLLEALTHPSYTGPHASHSYERLEFLGDAVLDYIISTRLFAHRPELSHQKMHAIRSAMANAAFLSFRMFETVVEEDVVDKNSLEMGKEKRAIWQFLRQSSHEVWGLMRKGLTRHEETREVILEGLRGDERFPWHLHSLNDAAKFLSDIVESVIGAVYVDSRGDINACEVFIRKLGILDHLERILRDGVDCLHPKERLGIITGNREVDYPDVSTDEDRAKGIHRRQVRVNGVDVGKPMEGLKKLNAETIAAWQACGIWEGGGNDVEMVDGDEDNEDGGEGGVVIGGDGLVEGSTDMDVDGDVDDSMEDSMDEDWHDAAESGIGVF